MALKIASTNGYASYDGSASPITVDGSTPWGFCCWVQRETDSGANDHVAGAFVDSSGTSPGVGFKVVTADNYTVWKYGDSDYTITAATLNGWVFLAYRTTGLFDGNAYHGIASTLTSVAGPVNPAAQLDYLLLGRYPGGTNPFRGTIAHFRVWSGAAPTQAEFEAEMVSAAAVKTTGLYLAWELDGNANDSSGNARNGTVTGTLSTDYSWTAGPLGGGGAQALEGAATGGATASADASVTKPIAGDATGGATAAGTLLGDVPLAGDATGGAAASGALTVESRRFEFTLYAVDGSTPLASKTGLWWAWWPSIAAMRTDPPDAAGTGASTDGSGVFSVAAPSALSAGDNQGFGIISDQDATPDATEAAFVGSFDVV